MRTFIPTRGLFAVALVACALVGADCCALAQRGHAQTQPRPSPPPSRLAPIQRQENPGARNAPRGEHLAEWMNQHNKLSPIQQQKALENEPGFRELPAQTQQRMRDRLTQLNSMPPQQRERVLQRNEAMEHLTPDQRLQVRGAMQQLAGLPPDQRKTVARNFRELRDLPPEQRSSAMGRMPLTDDQRSTLNNLLRVEPMLPPPDSSTQR